MSSGTQGSGSDHLLRRQEAIQARKEVPELAGMKDILIVEDETFDADRLRATLHVVLGYEVSVRRASTLGSALDNVIERRPDLVFLDDYLHPSDNALHTIPFLRRAGYAGPIIVVSSVVTRQRRVELRKAGASEAIHKDDLDSVTIAEVVRRVYLAWREAPPAAEQETLPPGKDAAD